MRSSIAFVSTIPPKDPTSREAWGSHSNSCTPMLEENMSETDDVQGLASMLTSEGHALLLRAQRLATEHGAAQCAIYHVLWACLELAEGRPAWKLRMTCKDESAVPVAAEAPSPGGPFHPDLVEAISVAAALPLDRDALLMVACVGPLPDAIADARDAWLADEPIEVPRGFDPDDPLLPWSRLERDTGALEFLELNVVADTVYARSGRCDPRHGRLVARPKVEIKSLKDAAAAQRSLTRRIAAAEKRGFRRVGDVLRPLPAEATEDHRRREREARIERRLQRLRDFEGNAVRFFEAWRARGHDPRHSFKQAQQLGQGDGDALAEACVRLAAEHFGVRFTFRTIIDEEHGYTGDVGRRRYAFFYDSPGFVADMAFGKIDTGDEHLDWGRNDSDPEVTRPDDHPVSRALARQV